MPYSDFDQGATCIRQTYTDSKHTHTQHFLHFEHVRLESLDGTKRLGSPRATSAQRNVVDVTKIRRHGWHFHNLVRITLIFVYVDVRIYMLSHKRQLHIGGKTQLIQLVLFIYKCSCFQTIR